MRISRNWKYFHEIKIIIAIAVITLLSGCIFFPSFPEGEQIRMRDAYVLYDDEYTLVEGEGYGNGTVVLTNPGIKQIKIISLRIYYADSVVGPWTEITENINIFQNISRGNPYIIEPLVISVKLTVRFPIPEENDDNTTTYRMTVTTDEGTVLDTAIEGYVVETDMQLSKDRPDISFTEPLGTIRRIHTIAPSVSDNSIIQNVIFEVSNATWSMTKTITSALWQWQWATFHTIANGSYVMKITVNDYAGLSAKVEDISFTVDNDYISPIISNIVGASFNYGQNVAEAGEPYFINATIADSGSAVSAVKEANVFYKLNETESNYTSIPMNRSIGNTWVTSIPASFIDTLAIGKKMIFFLIATDYDNNSITSIIQYASVV